MPTHLYDIHFLSKFLFVSFICYFICYDFILFIFNFFFGIPVSMMSNDFTDLYHININVCVLVIIVLLCIYPPWPPSFAKHNPLFHHSEYLLITFALHPTRVMVWLNTRPKEHFWEILREGVVKGGEGVVKPKVPCGRGMDIFLNGTIFFPCTKH